MQGGLLVWVAGCKVGPLGLGAATGRVCHPCGGQGCREALCTVHGKAVPSLPAKEVGKHLKQTPQGFLRNLPTWGHRVVPSGEHPTLAQDSWV